jgi:HEAT repeat protein
MNLEEFAELVDNMAIQHDYPGYEIRSLNIGLPEAAKNSSARMFGSALSHDNVIVRLAALRWFQEKPGIAHQYLSDILHCLEDGDEWVRMEAVRCLERFHHLDEKLVIKIAGLLKDPGVEVRRVTARALWKLGCKAEPVLQALQNATTDADGEVRGKVQKALRKLGAYVA